MQEYKDMKFEHNSFGKRLKSMLSVDARRMFTTRFFYIMVGTCFVMPILILVMTTMAGGGSVGFESTWQAVSSFSDAGSAMMMDMTTMCNMNLLYFLLSVLVCIFVADDFKSGYAKNLFTVRAKKADYVISKTVICFMGGACMILAFFVGAVIGGGIAGLSFDMGAAGVSGIVMCLITKILMVAVFVPIYLAISVAAKQRAWLSIMCSLIVGMFLFMVIPMMTPLDATIIHVILCLAGGAMLGTGLGAVSNLILKKTSLV